LKLLIHFHQAICRKNMDAPIEVAIYLKDPSSAESLAECKRVRAEKEGRKAAIDEFLVALL